MRLIRVFLISTVCMVFVSAPAEGAEFKRRVLDNGLVVLHAERHNLPFVVVSLLVKAGGVDETSEKAGLSNLTAGLLTEGTKSRTSMEIGEEVEFIGASLGASAGTDYSTVNLTVLKKDIKKGFELFSEVLLDPSFPEEEITRLKELTKGSLRKSEENPSFLASRAFIREVYGEHPYGRILRGSVESLDSITRDDIVRFYTERYRPNNSIMAVSGDITPSELDEFIGGYLGGWKAGEVPGRVDPPLPEPAKKVVEIDKDLTQANILLGHVGVRRDNPDYYALSVMNYILGGGGFSSRLMDTVRDTMGLAYSIYSTFSSSLYPGIFMVSVQTKNPSANTVIEEVLKEIMRIREQGVTEEELKDAKAYLTGSFPRKLETMSRIAGFLNAVEFYGLGLDYIEKYPDYINAVTLDDIKRVAGEYLHHERYVLVVVAKQSEADLKY